MKLVVLPVLGIPRGQPPTEIFQAHTIPIFINLLSTIAAILIGYWFFVTRVERQTASELNIQWKTAAIGLTSGVLLIGGPMAVLYAAGYYELEQVSGFNPGVLGIVLLVSMVVLFEELIFRGVIFGVLERSYGARPALITQAALFAAAHVFNDNWSGIMPIVSTFLIGLLWGAIFMLYRNIWAIALHHAAWNLTIFAVGLPLSGITDWRPFAPLQSNFAGPELLTGGLGGPELSILTPMLVIAALWYLAGKIKFSPAHQMS